ncbi:MAG: aminopeptidase N [Methylococcales bacterium]
MSVNTNPQTIYLKDYTVPEYWIQAVDLNFTLDDECTQVVAKLTLSRNPASMASGQALTLLGENLTLLSVELDQQELTTAQYQQTAQALIIHAVPQQQPFTLVIKNTINPKANTALEGLYLSKSMLCTQCEAEGFRKITYFLDRPDVMSKYTTTLIGDKTRYPVLLSNGNKVAQGELDNNRHWVTWEDPFNKPCYLFALVAGQLECLNDHFITLSGRKVDLQIFVEAHDLDKCAHAMQSLKHAMRWDEEVYGREYDLDCYMIVAVSHFNMGAMENKGLNIFNTKFVLARPDTATDQDYEHIEGVIAHEYFHNWTGNRVTCRDWFQLSLKEGFTVFRDQEFSGDQNSKAVKRIEEVNNLRTRQFAEDAGPMAHPVRPNAYIEINNFYTLTVYEKGAEVVRMLHTLIGKSGFRKGSDLYFERHDGQAVTCDDFVNAMEAANGIDLTQFRRWYAQAGTPVVKVQQRFDTATKTLHLSIRQYCPDTPGQTNKAPLHIPVRLGLLKPDGTVAQCQLKGGTQASDEIILQLTEAEQTFSFDCSGHSISPSSDAMVKDHLPGQPIVSLLRNFSAPVKLEMTRSLEELAFLLRYDSDPFNRWEAGQQLAGAIIMGLQHEFRADKLEDALALPVNPIIIEAFKHILAQDWQDLAYFSLLLSLPSETYLAEQMPVIDVEGIHFARERLLTVLAEQLQEPLSKLYQHAHAQVNPETGTSAAAMGRRRIKNTCLGYLGKLQKAEFQQLSTLQFKTANTMTDQIAALSTIINNAHPEKQNCLADFYQQWEDEALVIDKWFALQASSSDPDTFATVQKLLKHPAFDLKNPNRVRSVCGAFSQANPLHFHAANGQGYQLLADQVIALNTLNPQVASRMVSGLTQWRRYDATRQAFMKQQLERIMTTEGISPDVYEVASKSLV